MVLAFGVDMKIVLGSSVQSSPVAPTNHYQSTVFTIYDVLYCTVLYVYVHNMFNVL